MKKYLLSSIVVGSFLFYSMVARKKPEAIVPVSTPAASGPTSNTGLYKDGTYTGNVADAFYGNVQVAAVIQNGKLAQVTVLQSPNDRGRSIMINSYAMPILQSEAIQAQHSSVDIVSGATDSSQAFIQSLSSALQQAQG